MADTYYLMAKDIGDGPYLIGELRRLPQGEYQFRYLLRGDRFPAWYAQIPGFRDIRRTYGTREVRMLILGRIVPEEGSWAAEAMQWQFGMDKYDEWALLEALITQHERYKTDALPFCDSQQAFYFYDYLPDNTRRDNR